MAKFEFKKAEKHAAKLRMALIGISGSGKTFSALSIASGLGGKVAVIDTEHGRASAYAHKFDFDTLELEMFHPQTYIDAIGAAEEAGYDVLIIDSLSHAWIGKGGALELVDKAAKSSNSRNSFAAWRDVTPLHNALVERITTSKMHIIATMRAKARYDMEKDDRGKIVPRKVGMEPVQRDGLEYEFDVVGDLDLQHNYSVSKSTLDTIHPGDTVECPDATFGELILSDITGDGTLAPRQEVPKPEPAPTPEKGGQSASIKKMWATLRSAGVDVDDFREWLKAMYDVESTASLSPEQVEAIIANAEMHGAEAFVIPATGKK